MERPSERHLEETEMLGREKFIGAHAHQRFDDA